MIADCPTGYPASAPPAIDPSAFYRALWHNATDNLFVMAVRAGGAAFEFVAANEAATVRQVFSPEVAARYKPYYSECARANQVISFEDKLTAKESNDTCWWHLTIYPVKNATDEIVQLIVTCKEITARRRAEMALEDSRQVLQQVIDAMPAVVVWKDRESRYLGGNRSFLTMAGLSPGTDIVGQSDYDMPWKKEESDFFRACDRRIMANNEPELNIVEPILQAGGKQSWLRTSKIPLHNAEGAVSGLLCVIEDITERKEAEDRQAALNRELMQAMDKLKLTQVQMLQAEKMSSLGQMVAGVAHEINNPVNFIHGNLKPASGYIQDLLGLIELYRAAYPQPTEAIAAELEAIDLDFVREDLLKLLTSMSIGTTRIREIVLSLRNFSRLDESEAKTVDVHEGLDSTLTILSHRLKASASNHQVEVVKQYGALPPIDCYPSQLNQVFMNILANAIDALDHCAQPQIAIATEVKDERWAVIRIADNGPGIPPEVQPQILDPFFTTKPVGKGTGMGMSISHKIITEKHSGQLTFTSDASQGTEFSIVIPIRQPEAAR